MEGPSFYQFLVVPRLPSASSRLSLDPRAVCVVHTDYMVFSLILGLPTR